MGLDCYKYGTKNNHRRWAWNQIIRMSHKKPQELIVAYLAGPDDIDREIAIQKGFKDCNLIAIDADVMKVNKIKQLKRPAICIDIVDFIRNWTGNPPIDIIIADLCSGLTRKVAKDFMTSCFDSTGLASPTVIYINLMRGRDQVGGLYSKQFTEEVGINNLFKHRGFQFFTHLTWHYYQWMLQQYHGSNITYFIEDIVIDAMVKNMVPIYNSYKSKNKKTIMDSAIFKYYPLGPTNVIKDRDIGCKLAALKAWRTMRINNIKGFAPCAK